MNAAKANAEAAGSAQGKALADSAGASAKARAQGLGPIPVEFKAWVNDQAVRDYVPPTKEMNIIGNPSLGGRGRV